MIGAIAGDIIGSVYERHNIKRTDFPLFDPHSRFTDDTVLTVAVADAILTGSDYGQKMREWYRLYPDKGYGPGFRRWAASDSLGARYSMGNGAAMRVSPIAWAFATLDEVLAEARKSAETSHNHPEAIKGARAIASCVFLARTGAEKGKIRDYVVTSCGYPLRDTLEDIRTNYRFDATCPGSVPQAITAFLESDSYEDAVRKAVSLGGDSDTIACMAGGIAEAFYGGVPADIRAGVDPRVTEAMTAVIEAFGSHTGS
jgi:ADP-ribosylglycohydrolase